jgi:hypothetical protein
MLNRRQRRGFEQKAAKETKGIGVWVSARSGFKIEGDLLGNLL